MFVAEGEKLVREIVGSGLSVRKVYFTEGDFDDVAERVSGKEMERMSRLKTPAGVLALVEIPRWEFDPEALRGGLTIALDGVQNPGNVGTIVRLADWFGIRDVICSADCADLWSPKVVQATMGAVTRVRVHYGDLGAMIGGGCHPVSHLDNHPVSYLDNHPVSCLDNHPVSPAGCHPSTGGEPALPAVPVYGTFLEGESIYDAELSGEGVVVLGSEGRGISPAVERLVTRKLFIPPFSADKTTPALRATPPQEGNHLPTPESLNVAVAAAIVCSEFRRRPERQRR